MIVIITLLLHFLLLAIMTPTQGLPALGGTGHMCVLQGRWGDGAGRLALGGAVGGAGAPG